MQGVGSIPGFVGGGIHISPCKWHWSIIGPIDGGFTAISVRLSSPPYNFNIIGNDNSPQNSETQSDFPSGLLQLNGSNVTHLFVNYMSVCRI